MEFSNIVKSKLNQLNIAYIDMNSAFSEYELNQIFYYGLSGHYSAEGYRLVAETISERLEAEGFIPSNSNN